MAGFSLEHLDHETFTAILHTLLEEGLDLFRCVTVVGFGEGELSLDFLETFTKQLAPFRKRAVQERLCEDLAFNMS